MFGSGMPLLRGIVVSILQAVEPSGCYNPITFEVDRFVNVRNKANVHHFSFDKVSFSGVIAIHNRISIKFIRPV